VVVLLFYMYAYCTSVFTSYLLYLAFIRLFVPIVLTFFIFTAVAALAHGGAIPFPTPAGLWPGGYIPVELLNMQWGWRVVSGGGDGVAGFRWW
jgi:hypothetical protein